MAENNGLENRTTLVILDGKKYQQTADGTLMSGGRIVKLSPQRQQAMQERRKQISQESVDAGIMEGTKSKTVAEGIRKMTAKRAEVAMNDTGRAGNDAWRGILIAGNYYPDKKVDVQGSVKHRVIPEFPQRYLDYIGETIDGEVEDE